ncbi:MAG: hypothetical protein ACUVX8_06550 [Candidatus Zipacnadales bacterium]
MLRHLWSKRPIPTEPPPLTDKPTDEELIERIARELVARRLAAPATFLLESSRPLSFLASQGLILLGPFVDAALEVPHYDAFVRMIECRENVEKLIERIEQLEEERLRGQAPQKDDLGPRGEK